MSKKNRVLGVEVLSPKEMVIHSKHFTVHLDFGDGIIEAKSISGGRRIDSCLSYAYNVTSRTTYATHFQVKKFINKFVMATIKDAINRDKGKNNG